MKKKIIYSFLIFLAIVLQTSVLPVVFASHAFGDIVLMLILAGVVVDGYFGFFGWAIFAGIVYDLATYTQMGVHALIFLLTVYFVSFFSRRFSVEFKGVGMLLFLVFVVFASIISRMITALSIAWDSETFHQYLGLVGGFNVIFLQIVCNVILFAICFYILRKIKAFFDIN